MGPWLLLSSRSYFGQISHVASRIWNDLQLSPLQLVWWWYADVFCKVAFGTYSCCGSCSCGRAGAKPQACWYIYIYEVHCCVRAWHESSSENRQSQTPPPELGKAQSWESEWLPTMGSHAGFLKMQPGTSPSTLAQKKAMETNVFFPLHFFCDLTVKV